MLTFESGVTCDNSTPLAVVQGVIFRQQWTCFNFEQSPYTARSGTNRLYANGSGANGSSGSFGFGTPTVFAGAYFSGATSVSFNLFFQGALVGSSSTFALTAVPTFLASGYAGVVDAVTVTGSSIAYVMDDVTFGTAATTVPEPATVALVGGGLLAVGAWRRRMRHGGVRRAGAMFGA